MTLRSRLLLLSVATVAAVVLVLAALHVDTLIATWLNLTLDRSEVTGRQLQAFLVRRIDSRMARLAQPPATLEATKRAWQHIVSDDRDLALMLELAMAQSGSIVEIQISNELGMVLASSNPSRIGSAIVSQRSLRQLYESSPLERLMATWRSGGDYETRVDLGIQGQSTPVFRIQILVSIILLRDAIKPSIVSLAVALGCALLLAIGFAYVSARLALRPLQSIGHSLDRIITGDPLAPARPEDREVAAVESKLSLIGAQVSGARQDADHLRTSIGNLVRAVAHEIKNPLNAMALRLEILRTRLDGRVPEANEEIDLLSREVARMDQVTRTFLDLNRPVQLERTEVQVGALVNEVLDLVRPEADASGATIQSALDDGSLVISADAGLLRQALLNIVKNALEAMRAGGSLTVTVEDRDDCCEISVADTGVGIEPEIQSRIFEPYFSRKQNGSGIGLALARRVVELHGGRIRLQSEPGQGTTITLVVPLARLQVEA